LTNPNILNIPSKDAEYVFDEVYPVTPATHSVTAGPSTSAITDKLEVKQVEKMNSTAIPNPLPKLLTGWPLVSISTLPSVAGAASMRDGGRQKTLSEAYTTMIHPGNPPGNTWRYSDRGLSKVVRRHST
jgi:hypothetical protein